ncbi:MAG: 16S rRNA (cytidine(1402)-2'-O)-methyltransferase [Candidatus Pacebacteria bacterium]|nr:16S rRNA (cytidine(1402)-2'-O)-methyltransferase [Candidatus Paceibacterota bacterium]MDD5721600.1 16S rRNA (cytidine(1402)-2'-O)-methyltransferase [Candidatus Paceibacterota bacterium]
MIGKLFIVATPIGNLEDISLRAKRVLQEVDLILCEDTRKTRKLLSHFEIKTSVLSYHQHSTIKKMNQIKSLLEQGKDLALVSDAGTPGISDPGNKLISFLINELEDFEIIPIPGCSALITAASISGFPMDKFVFLGFPPSKNKRNQFFKELFYQLQNFKHPVVFYESSHRIIKTLEDIYNKAEGLDYEIVVCRELTKKFETIYRGTIKGVIEKIKNDKIKGEFTIVIYIKK